MNLPRGLYAITPDWTDSEALMRACEAALDGGAVALQYRNKRIRPDQGQQQLMALRYLCSRYQRPLIVNDDLELALSLEADGVHLGRDDGDLAAARAQLGPERLLGASCYDSLESALAARAAGADYVAFGAAFPSATKPGAVAAPLTLYREARQALDCPIVAIGGITPANGGRLVAAGVDALAVIAGLFEAEGIKARAQAYAALFD